MLKGPAISLFVFVALIIGLVGYRYQQYVLAQNYLVDAVVPCDSTMQSCFAADCSPDEDPECDVTPYEKVELPASLAPKCLFENSCDSFICTEANHCIVTHCSEDALGDGEVCAPQDPISDESSPIESIPQDESL